MSRLKIIVIGAGKVGYVIATQLSAEGHDITVIDSNPEKIDMVSNTLDVICAVGNGTSFDLLKEVGVESADIVISATGQDEVNLVCCAAAKYLGAKHAVVRLRNPEYYFKQRVFLREGLGISEVINPDLETASEISRILQFPTAVRVDTFANGRLELVEYKVPRESGLCDLPLYQLGKKFAARVLVCAAERAGKIFIPNGNFVLQAGDRLSIAGAHKELRHFFINVGAYKKPVRSVMLLGGGRIASYLGLQLLEAGIRVTIIERDPKQCDKLCDLLPRAVVLCGDGCKREVLLEEGLKQMDAFVTLTGYDEENIIVSMFAASCGIGKVVTKTSDEHFAAMLDGSGLDCFVCPKLLAAQEIIRYVRAKSNAAESGVEKLYSVADGKVEALEFIVNGMSRCRNTPLKDLQLKSDVLVAAVIRAGKCQIADGNTTIQEGDRVVIVTTKKGLRDLNAILE